MPRLPRVNAAETARALKKGGFVEDHQKGSHLTLRHPDTGQRVVVPMHARKTLKPKTLKSILQQAGLTVDEFIRLLHDS